MIVFVEKGAFFNVFFSENNKQIFMRDQPSPFPLDTLARPSPVCALITQDENLLETLQERTAGRPVNQQTLQRY